MRRVSDGVDAGCYSEPSVSKLKGRSSAEALAKDQLCIVEKTSCMFFHRNFRTSGRIGGFSFTRPGLSVEPPKDGAPAIGI
jgi:hypothetical protein